MASPMRLLSWAAVVGMALAVPEPGKMHRRALDRRQSASPTSTLTTTSYTPYYAALATGYTTDPASAATSTTTAHQPCVTQPEAGTYCGFINPEDACSPQPDGYGPVPKPDTPSAFLNLPTLHSLAQAAPTTVPSSDGNSQYVQVFKDLNASVSGGAYLGLYDLQTYDVAQCASLCDTTKSCISFDLFAERDPSLRPTANDTTVPSVWGYWCPNPPSMTTFRCTLWANVISAAEATNYGSYQEQFHIVITASDGYTKTNGTGSSCPSVSTVLQTTTWTQVSTEVQTTTSVQVTTQLQPTTVSETVTATVTATDISVVPTTILQTTTLFDTVTSTSISTVSTTITSISVPPAVTSYITSTVTDSVTTTVPRR